MAGSTLSSSSRNSAKQHREEGGDSAYAQKHMSAGVHVTRNHLYAILGTLADANDEMATQLSCSLSSLMLDSCWLVYPLRQCWVYLYQAKLVCSDPDLQDSQGPSDSLARREYKHHQSLLDAFQRPFGNKILTGDWDRLDLGKGWSPCCW